MSIKKDPKALKGAIENLSKNNSSDPPLVDFEQRIKQLKLASESHGAQIASAIQVFKNQHSEQILNNVNQLAENVRKISLVINTVLSTKGSEIDRFLKSIAALANVDWDVIIERHSATVKFAALEGWFVQPEFDLPQIGELSTLTENNDYELLDNKFTSYIEACESDILERMLQEYPERQDIINEAFRLHREARYLASIPLFLMLAEGIALGKTNLSVFNTRHNKPEIAKIFKATHAEARTIENMFSMPLSENHPLSKSKPGKLNRHRVLHGRDLSYGTKKNSLQALSFLGNIGWIFSRDNHDFVVSLIKPNEEKRSS